MVQSGALRAAFRVLREFGIDFTWNAHQDNSGARPDFSLTVTHDDSDIQKNSLIEVKSTLVMNKFDDDCPEVLHLNWQTGTSLVERIATKVWNLQTGYIPC